VLVNEADEAIGSMEKMEVHQKGLLHRAFSIFIFNKNGEMLLQQRADNKYHSAGLWTNACCSHPQPGEETLAAAGNRLREEMGFETPLQEAFTFVYKTDFENGLTEHEFDHVFIGYYDGPVFPDSNEAKDHSYKSMADVKADIGSHPELYTSWFKIAFPMLETYLAQNSA
jgi:isopentenyl-diphosphate Delta-isomerase